jgi:DNA polymerase-3 subunit gamma/tau
MKEDIFDKMPHYHPSSRQFRPQRFDQVLGQDTCVQTLKNTIRMGRVAHAYLFCGTRGTGKTTLARIFAKALSCPNLDKESIEPCCTCSLCKEISLGTSLDVLEIDGASNRGIDDIRQLSESIGYAPTKGAYKIFLIDEVHMLTKEAFNALLKNLEEPPPSAKFFFATTEPNKIPETILSRCQRFNLRRLGKEAIVQKLSMIAHESDLLVDQKILHTLAQYADGGLRDAESLFDQLIAFANNNEITTELVEEILGIAPHTWFHEIDQAILKGNTKVAFDITEKILFTSKDIGRFIEDLASHFRKLYLLKIDALAEKEDSPLLHEVKLCLNEEQIQKIFHYIYEAMKAMKAVSSQRFLLEKLLLDIISVRYEIPLPYIVRKLAQLEESFASNKNEGNISPQKAPEIVPEITPVIVKERPVTLQRPTPFLIQNEEQEKQRQETLMHFAAIELEGTLHKKKQSLPT